jgi:hypothetical protein
MTTSGGKRRADTEAMRAKAAALFANGARLAEVARELGITERRARTLKADVAGSIKAAAAATVDGIVEGGNRARAVIVANAEDMAQTLVDAARGQLEHGDENRDADPIERDPQMINARTKAASAALQFILATKIDATFKADITAETAAAVVVIAKAAKAT